MNIIVNLLIFCVVLFLYLHVHFHLKTSDDLEVYEIEQPSKDKLEEICDLRQPVIFEYPNERMLESCTRTTARDTYGAFEVKLRNVSQQPSDDEEMYIPLSLSAALAALGKDGDSKYLVENNDDFLQETGMIKVFKYNDAFIRPYMVSNCMYDFAFASNKTQTPFRYEVNYRNYMLVTEGSVKIKLAPPKSAKYLYEQKDYENFEFRSPVNPWNVQQQYKPDFDKIKCLEVTVAKGFMIYVPAFWWYSIEYSDNTSIASFKYRTYMNNVAILPKLCMRLLQSQNVKRQIAPTVAVNEPSEETVDDKNQTKESTDKKEN